MTIMLVVFVNGYEARQIKTRSFLKNPLDCDVIQKEIQSNDINAYYDLIFQYWGKEDIILLEQDIVPTVSQYKSLLNCSKMLCNYSYDIPISIEKGYQILNTGFGFCRFSLAFQKKQSFAKIIGTDTRYINLDSKMNHYLMQNGLSYHNHGSIKHVHYISDLDYDFKTKRF